MGESIGLEVEADDIEVLLQDHSIGLTTEELEHLQDEQEKNWLIELKKKKRISSLDLWTNPDKVEPFLATWGERLLAAT